MRVNNLKFLLLAITTFFMLGIRKNIVVVTHNNLQKKVFFREMVNYDMKLRAAVSNSAINNVFHTYRAFNAMTRFISEKNPLYKSSLRKIKRNLRKRNLLKYVNNIQNLALKASFLLKRKSKVGQQVWRKIDGYISKITMNCRRCHLQTK